MRLWLYALQISSYLLWFPLITLTIDAVRRRGVARYPLIFTYLVVTFLLAVMQLPAAMAYRLEQAKVDWLGFMHGIGEGIATALLLAVVMSLIFRASEPLHSRRLLRAVLIAGAAIFMATSFAIHNDGQRPISVWIVAWARDLNFCAALLDFALWVMLLTWRGRDVHLLLVTGGMGIMFAGDAIGEAVRHLAITKASWAVFSVGSAVTMLADSTFLYVWWRAFRSEAKPALKGAR